MFRFAVLLFVFFSAAAQAGGIRVASWNIERLGHGQNKNYEALARVGGAFDLIAVQEAMTAPGLYRFVDALTIETGEPWNVIYSHQIGRGSYREKYGYIWRESRVDYVDGAVVFFDVSDQFAREPYAARFQSRDGHVRFVLATVHILYGRSEADRLPEIQALAEMWDWLEESFPEDDNFILAGDFNLRPGHASFAPLRERARPLITSGATTLSTINGRYANLYDNILVGHRASLTVTEASIVKFPAMLGWTHEQARRYASDHAPVVMTIATPGPFPARQLGSDRILPAPSAEQAGARPVVVADAPFHGNRNSQILHHPGCPGYAETAPHNRVAFETETAAIAQGFRRARNCTWPD